MIDHTTDRRHLVTTAYATGANLAARQSIYRFQQPQLYFGDWALRQTDWTGVGRAVDVGCGSGAYLQRLAGRVPHLIGIDLSMGMLTDVAGGLDGEVQWRLAAGDAQALPLADGCADVVLAMHMLYHVPDIPAAVRELRRVLRRDGVLLATTNGEAHLRELFDLLASAIATESGGARPQLDALRRSFFRFAAENGGEFLATEFARVEWSPAAAELVLPEAEPVIDYFTSMRGWVEPLLPAGVTWDSCMAAARRLVEAHVGAHGAFRVATAAGVFVCR